MPRSSSFKTDQSGVTLTELVLTIAMLGLMCGIAIIQTGTITSALDTGTDNFAGVTQIARSYAVASTTPHRVVAPDAGTLDIQYGGPCGDPGATWTSLPDERFELPSGVELADTSWEICFNTRGWTTDVHEIRVLEANSYQDVSVLLGGSVRLGSVNRY